MNFKAAFVRALNRHLLPRHRLVLRKSGHEGENLPLTPKLRYRFARNVAAITQPYFVDQTRLLDPTKAADLVEWILAFLDLYDRRPIRDNTGGLSLNGSLWLHLFLKASAPRFILESGTWQGHSAWLMAETLPDAEIVTFDIEHENLLVRHPRVTYRRGDWTTAGINLATEHSLAFFDDHINHAQRVREAAEAGFAQALFDDNFTAEALCMTGDPPAPTLAMLHDAEIGPKELIEWRYRGRTHNFFGLEADWDARRYIAEYHPVPSLTSASAYRQHMGLAFVRLRT